MYRSNSKLNSQTFRPEPKFPSHKINKSKMFTGTRNIMQLDEGNFERAVLDDRRHIWFVMFYSPNCGHCREASVDFKKAATELEELVRFGIVDGQNNKRIMKRFNVEGYPTFLLFGENKMVPKEFNGHRNATSMIKYCALEAKNIVRSR